MKIKVLHPTDISLTLEELKNIILNESRGMLARTQGETFTKDNKDYEFLKTVIFPEQGKKFANKEELQAAINAFAENEKITILEENIFGDFIKAKAAILVVMKDIDTEQNIGIVKYRSSVTDTTVWQQAKFGMETGFMPGSKDSNKLSSSNLEMLKLKPSDLITNYSPKDVQELQSEVISKAGELTKNSQLPQVCFDHIQQIFNAVNQNQKNTLLKGGAIYAKSYNKSFAEILAPISVITGWLSGGDRASSEEELLGQGFFYKDMKIKFNQSKTEGLYDSVLEMVVGENKKIVKISSKAGSGAASSAKSFMEILLEFRKRDKGAFDEFYRNKINRRVVDIILDISRETSVDGPIIVGKKLGILNQEDADIVEKISKKLNSATFPEGVKLNASLTGLMETYKAKASPNYKPGLHLYAALTKKICETLNQDKIFSDVIKNVLSKENLIQVNSSLKLKGEDCEFTSFKITYPPKYSGQIKFDSSGEYTTTEIKGRISFKIPPMKEAKA